MGEGLNGDVEGVNPFGEMGAPGKGFSDMERRVADCNLLEENLLGCSAENRIGDRHYLQVGRRQMAAHLTEKRMREEHGVQSRGGEGLGGRDSERIYVMVVQMQGPAMFGEWWDGVYYNYHRWGW